jgi:hypothetical protein
VVVVDDGVLQYDKEYVIHLENFAPHSDVDVHMLEAVGSHTTACRCYIIYTHHTHTTCMTHLLGA